MFEKIDMKKTITLRNKDYQPFDTILKSIKNLWHKDPFDHFYDKVKVPLQPSFLKL